MKDAEKEFGEGVIHLSYRYGWWLTALALIATIVAGTITEERARRITAALRAFATPDHPEGASGSGGPPSG